MPTEDIPAIASWDLIVDGLRDLGPQMLARLPVEMRNDPQIQQEVARVMLSSFASNAIGAISNDPDRPFFVPGPNWSMPHSQPNADTNYLTARIAPGGSYRLRGRRGSLRLARLAQFGLREGGRTKTQGAYITLSNNDLNTLAVDEDDRYDVILSPGRPEGHQGDWWRLEPGAAHLLLRLVADDWASEQDCTISIERIDQSPTRPRRSAADLEGRLRALIREASGMALLLVNHVAVLQEEGYVNKMKIFDVAAIGGQLTGQFYYEGAFDLDDDEALIVEAKAPDQCLYYSMILTNEIFETINWYDNHSSLNDSQLKVDSDGVLRVVVCANDPGVWNWLDTAGHRRGVVQGRWTDCSAEPIPTVRKVALKDIPEVLPADTPRVTLAQREAVIRDRRAQLQQRPLW